jgi:hypothetical protein
MPRIKIGRKSGGFLEKLVAVPGLASVLEHTAFRFNPECAVSILHKFSSDCHLLDNGLQGEDLMYPVGKLNSHVPTTIPLPGGSYSHLSSIHQKSGRA